MYEDLISFYKFGFVIFKNVPTENNFIVKFANSIEVYEEQILANFLM